MTTTQWIFVAGFGLVYLGQVISHFFHGKKIDAVSKTLEGIGQKVEQNAPAIAQAVISTGLVAEVKQEQK